MASDDEEKLDDKEEDSPKKKTDRPKLTISSINQQLDDLSYSLGLTFPSFGISSTRASSNVGGFSGGSQYQTSYMPRSYGQQNQAPRDLLTKKVRQEVVENELQTHKQKPQVVSSQIAGSHTRIDHPNRQEATEKRDFGIQTSDSLYSKTPDTFMRLPTDNKKRVEFAGASGGKETKNAGNSYDVGTSHMKQFTKNVQDLYKRKQKAVYGEDEFRIAKRLE